MQYACIRIALVASVFLASCGREGWPSDRAQPPLEGFTFAPSTAPSLFDDRPLGVCDTDRIVFRATPVGDDEYTWTRLREKRVLDPEHVTRAVHGLATIGITHGEAPTAGSRVAMRDRSVWIVVREGLRGRSSGGPPLTAEQVARGVRRPVSYFTAFANVYDARTSSGLQGWSCASRTEDRDDRTVTEWWGADPSLEVRRLSAL